uniref:Ribonuclease Z n=1 Tax=Panagrolaimus sp. JU765 TaxID=591449 RepID=A0AC34QLW2_9BILA
MISCFCRFKTEKFVRRIHFSFQRLKKDSSEDLYADIQKRVHIYKQQLRKHIQASFKHRQLKSQISNLNEAMAAMEAKTADTNIPDPIPTRISLEILSSGTGNMEPSILLKTPTRGYLVNCPEVTSRMLPSFSLRANNINDILITSCNIRTIGGLSGFMLSQCKGVSTTRIHGPPFIKNYLEFLRPFADAEFGEVKYPGILVEQPYDQGSYTDVTFKINYIPMYPYDQGSYTDVTFKINYIPMYVLSEKESANLSKADRLSIAYLIETMPGQRRIDMMKIMEKKVPKGPLIGRLKAGKSVTLEDGRIIHPEDVYADDDIEGIRDSTVLIVDAVNEGQLQSLLAASVLRPYFQNEKTLDYLVHITRPEVFETDAYQSFSSKFNNSTSQIICNGTGIPDPHLESVHKIQRAHNRICDKFFPELWPQFEGQITEHSEAFKDEKGRILARPMQRFVLRGPKISRLEECSVDLRSEMNPSLQRVITNKIDEKFKTSVAAVPTSDSEPFPKIIFLGTSSAVPSKYRNVTSMLLQTENHFYMIDCGEGTFGQMKSLFGEKINDVLRRLNVIFLTHTHQDHTNGLVTLLQERNKACMVADDKENPKKLVVVCNRNVLKHLHTFSMRFYNVTDFAKFIIPVIYADKQLVPANLTKLFEQMNLSDSIPDLEAVAVKVNHTSDAVGYILTSKEKNRKIVFSGDTTPCDFLIEHGKGAHVLVHEATFEDEYEDDALYKKHSTMLQAVNVGKAMEAKHVILTHFSARYPKVPALPDYLDKNGVGVAMDNLVVSMEDLPKLPLMNPTYRELYDEELFEILKKTQQRGFKLQPGPPPAKKAAYGIR